MAGGSRPEWRAAVSSLAPDPIAPMTLPHLPPRPARIRRGGAAVVLALAALLTLAGDSAAQREAWRGDRSCAAGGGPGAFRVYVRDYDSPDSPNPPCPRSECVDLPGGRRVCSCISEDGDFLFRLERPGTPALVWDAGGGMVGMGRFDVVEGDLDGDGADELAVVRLADFGNGLGVTYWQMHVIDGRRPNTPPPAPLELSEYSFDGTFLRAASGGPCRVLVAEWVNGRDAVRTSGLYLEAKWMRYADGRFTRDEARPIVRRRYTFAFQDERLRTENRGPFLWLRRHGSANLRGFVAETADEM